MQITTDIEDKKADFVVYGLTADTNIWKEFLAGSDYEVFLITKQTNQ